MVMFLIVKHFDFDCNVLYAE